MDDLIDQDLFYFFSKLICDDQEVEIVRQVLSGMDPESIIADFIESLREQKDDNG